MSEDKQDAVLREVRALTAAVQQLIGLIVGNPGGGVIATGRVTPPADLGPAIAALAPEAREWLEQRLDGRPATAEDVVAGADWWESQPKLRAVS